MKASTDWRGDGNTSFDRKLCDVFWIHGFAAVVLCSGSEKAENNCELGGPGMEPKYASVANSSARKHLT